LIDSVQKGVMQLCTSCSKP